MRIETIELTNFKGCAYASLNLPQIIALCGKNGVGKTTLLEAIRFGLCGEEPEGDIIKSDRLSCTVRIMMKEGEVPVWFERTKERDKPSSFRINGKKTTKTSMEEKIEVITGIPTEKVKILSSGDVVASMKPQEFASLILEYIPEKLKLEKVLDFLPSVTSGMLDIIDANLPAEGIDISVIDAFDEMLRSTRKSLKTDLQAKKLLREKYPSVEEKPEKKKDEVEKRLAEIRNLANEYKIYLIKLEAYNKEVKARENTLNTIMELKKEADKISVERPNPSEREALNIKKNSCEDAILKQKGALNAMTAALNALNNTLVALNSAVCPISEKITCKTDKSVAREEITETIISTEEGIKEQEGQIKSLEGELEKIKKEINIREENVNLYNKKIEFLKRIKTMEDEVPAEPIKPEEIKEVNVEDEIYQLEAALSFIERYNEGLKLDKDIETLTEEVGDYEALVKAVAEKGPVRTGIVNSYIGIFENICNERSAKIRPEITFRFESSDGVVVYMNTGKAELTYADLSGGEKAYMLYILLDMLNQLVGTRVLFLDELSVIDGEIFDKFLDLVLANKSDYDHIVLSAVNHAETKLSFEKKGIPIIEKIIE